MELAVPKQIHNLINNNKVNHKLSNLSLTLPQMTIYFVGNNVNNDKNLRGDVDIKRFPMPFCVIRATYVKVSRAESMCFEGMTLRTPAFSLFQP